MRKLITEATWTAIKKCPAFKRFFERVMSGKADRKKIALIATAHVDPHHGRDAAQRRSL
jgi:hypothetical protein